MTEDLTQKQQDELAQNIEDVVRENDVDEEKTRFLTTTTGAKIEILTPPDRLIQALWRKYPEPRVPMIERKDGSRTALEPNPDDPEYIRAVNDRTLLINDGVERITLLKGIRILELPPDVPAFENDEEFAEEFEDLMGYPPATQRTARYLEWLSYRILPASSDMLDIQRVAFEIIGVDAEDVAAAEDSFRSSR